VNRFARNLLTTIDEQKSTAQLQALLEAPSTPAAERALVAELLAARAGAGQGDRAFALLLACWPWLPLLAFLFPNALAWVIVYFTMMVMPFGALSAALATIVAAWRARRSALYRKAVVSGALGCLVWFALYLANAHGLAGRVHT
jgi:hypothetical protein